MNVNVNVTAIEFALRGEFIPLDALLKATGIASSGGVAKMMVGAGDVQVDGREELRKTCKIRAGQVVDAPGARVRVAGAQQPQRPVCGSPHPSPRPEGEGISLSLSEGQEGHPTGPL